MSRGLDWSPLDLATDPVPGEPGVVQAMGRHYAQVAEAIELAAQNLRDIAGDDGQRSEAIEAFREKAGEVADDISRAHERYAGVGHALSSYAGELERAQTESALALRQAEVAQEALARARRAAAEASAAAARATPEAPDPGAASAARRAEELVADALADLAAARRRVEDAVSDRDAAARTAVGRIEDVEGSGDLNDSWWDDWGAGIVTSITSIAEKVAMVCGVAALLVGWIPIVGQALAAILGTVALIAAAVALVGNLALATTEYGGYGDVLMSAVGVASFGVGRVASAALRGSRGGAAAATRLTAGRLAATSPASRAAANLPSQANPQAAVRALSGSDEIAGMTRHQARAAAAEARAEGMLPSAFTMINAFRSVPADVRHAAQALGRPGSWSAAGAALRGGAGLGGPGPALANALRAVGEADAAADIARLAGAHGAVSGSAEVAEHLARVRVHGWTVPGAVATGLTTDGWGLVQDVLAGSSPAERLDLPRTPVGAVP